MLANPSKFAEETASPTLFPEAEADGWGNSMIEAYTDCLWRGSAS
jgi:hypothetical protein